jgi:hypothetical protein
MSLWAILFRFLNRIAQNDLKLHNARERTIKLKDLNMIAQSDLKIHNALERLNLVLIIYII